MKSIKKILAMLSITTLAFSFTACGGGTSTPNAGATAENTSAAGDPLKVHIDVEVASMDPQVAVDGTSFEVLAAVTEGLYSLDANGSAIPAMADKVEKSEDGLTYTVTLKDAKWSNGTPVTANDFVFAWRRLVDPKTASEYAFMGGIAGLKNADDISAGKVSPDQLGVTAKDDKTLVIELDTPVPFFESLMAFPSFFPVNEEFYNKCGDKFATTVDTILCNGAFKVTSYEPAATTINLEKNADYWDANKVQLSGIQYQVIKDSQQAMLAYQNGDLDVATLSGEQVEQFQADPEFQSIMAGYLWYISPNLKTPGLENENLRKALALSYDKDAIVNNILKDGSIKADFAVPTLLATGPDGKDFRDGTDTYLSTDKAKALEYYDKAKEELGKDSFSYTMIVEDTESAQNVAQFIQAEIQKTLPGVTINIETMPKKNRVERMQEGTFELGLTRWGPDYADPMTYLDMWTTDSPNNYGFWSNAEFDQIIQSAKKGELALDVNARWDALKKAEKMVMDEAVIFPVYQKGNAVMIKKNVSGIEFHSVAINRVYKNATKN
ncbi:peptide ABC transporter substrate-binding protein [Clostridium neonatale]|uniref:peptide ABC transporter substrate-binding protein n=1 Tax=Clostridium neonatale TaxID=137838 RepID=UPI00291BB2DC|nr:ABC transporter, substrate-binding protein [Clostridium neonatale]CAI3667788.1 ABC transporter, substrate-binding protein [Clostridium neonatale]CAI3697532.1 ABC transporter, substrate-binding protein [Clostridium neonatale]CAI3714366.1 ABC transporter, substrate-binding protein [Clostridium neonatale]